MVSIPPTLASLDGNIGHNPLQRLALVVALYLVGRIRYETDVAISANKQIYDPAT